MPARIFFGCDRHDLAPEARGLPDAKVPAPRANGGVALVIEGHADERGSEEHNLALGMRRANAARQYLIGFGLEGERLAVASKGEDEPLAAGARSSHDNNMADGEPPGPS